MQYIGIPNGISVYCCRTSQAFAVVWHIIVDSTHNSSPKFLTYVTVRANWVHNPTYGGTIVLYCTTSYYCYLLHEVHNTGLFTEGSKIHAVHHYTTALAQFVLVTDWLQDFMCQYTIILTGTLTYRILRSAVIFYQTLEQCTGSLDRFHRFVAKFASRTRRCVKPLLLTANGYMT